MSGLNWRKHISALQRIVNRERLQEQPRERSVWSAPRLILAAAIIVVFVYLYGEWNSKILQMISSGLPSLLSFAAAFIAFVALLRNGVKRGDRWTWIWACASLAMFLVFLGELVDVFYSLILRVPIPVPSVADVFFFAAYPFFLWALLSLMWPFRGALSTKDLALGLAVPVLVVLVLAFVSLPYIAQQHTLASVVVSLAYPFLDVIMLCTAIPAFLVIREGTFWRPARFLIIGVTLILAGDILFDYSFLRGMGYPTPSNPFEILSLWAYLAFGLGFYLKLREPRI